VSAPLVTDPERHEIHDRRAKGESIRQIAKGTGWGRTTISRVLAEPLPAPAALPDHMQPESLATDLGPGPSASDPAIEQVRFLLSTCRAQLDQAQRLGDRSSAARLTRDAAYLTNTLSKLERLESADEDVFRISRSEVAAIDEQMRDRIAAILARPLHCAQCARALSVNMAMGGEQHVDPNASARAR
jgi:hypothetical protein